MNQKRLIYITILSMTLLSVFFSFAIYKKSFENNQKSANNNSDINKIRVVTSFYPLYEFTKQVGGNMINLVNITPVGMEAHDYEPDPQQIQEIYQSNLLITNGAGLDVWSDKLAKELQNLKIETVNMQKALGNTDSKVDLKTNLKTDPHFWLDPILAQKQVDIIAERLGSIDTKNKENYVSNAENYKQKLGKLDQKYQILKSGCAENTIISSHDAFNYLSERYGFQVLTISGFDPNSEPSNKQLAELSQIIKDKNLKYVAFESLSSPKLSQTLADETGSKTIVLNPIEGLTQEQIDNNQDYISISEQNLESLKTMLKCS